MKAKSLLCVILCCVMMLSCIMLASCDFFNKESEVVCQSCEAKCNGNSNFCTNCGAVLEKANACQACKAENSADSKYCTSCGASLNDGDAYEGSGGNNEYESGYNDDSSYTDTEQTVWVKTRTTQKYLDATLVLEYYYDSNGFLVAMMETNVTKGILLCLTEYTNDNCGNPTLVQTTSPRLNSSGNDYYQVEYFYQYDANRIISVTDTEWNYTTTYTYDNNDRLILESDSNGSKYQYEYDSNGNLIKKYKIGIHSSGAEYVDLYATFFYGSNGLLIWKEENGVTYEYSYDSVGNIIKETEQNNGVTIIYEYEYMSLSEYLRLGKDKILPEGAGQFPENVGK